MWVSNVAPSSTSAISGEMMKSTNAGKIWDFGVDSESDRFAHALAVGCSIAVTASPVGSLVH
jgi:hypothetical protein